MSAAALSAVEALFTCVERLIVLDAHVTGLTAWPCANLEAAVNIRAATPALLDYLDREQIPYTEHPMTRLGCAVLDGCRVYWPLRGPSAPQP